MTTRRCQVCDRPLSLRGHHTTGICATCRTAGAVFARRWAADLKLGGGHRPPGRRGPRCQRGCDPCQAQRRPEARSMSATCKGCSTALPPQQYIGRPRIWCSDRCRKQTMYSQPCLDCGTPTNGSDGLVAEPRCIACAMARRRVWTPDAIIAAIRAWADQYGAPPAADDFNVALSRTRGRFDRVRRYVEGDYPTSSTVTDRFGTWNAAIAAAGYMPLAPGRHQSERLAAA